jgi:hypothetical protein
VAPGNLARSQQRRRNPQFFRANVLQAERNDYHQVAELAPTNLPPDVRADIVQFIL